MKASGKAIVYLWSIAGVLLIGLIIFSRLDKPAAPADAGLPSPAPSADAKGASSPIPAEELPKAIVGKWQAIGYEETPEFRTDGTVVITGKHPMTVRYAFPASGRLQFTDKKETAVYFTDVRISGDQLSMRNEALGSTVSYRRSK